MKNPEPKYLKIELVTNVLVPLDQGCELLKLLSQAKSLDGWSEDNYKVVEPRVSANLIDGELLSEIEKAKFLGQTLSEYREKKEADREAK